MGSTSTSSNLYVCMKPGLSIGGWLIKSVRFGVIRFGSVFIGLVRFG